MNGTRGPVLVTLPRTKKCAKCGHADLNVRWATGRHCRHRDNCGGIDSEHMDVTCRVCGYGWAEEAQDAEMMGRGDE